MSHCLKGGENARQIILYLSIVRLVLGQPPDAQLLQHHNLSTLLTPTLLTAWKVGDFETFRREVDTHAIFWMKRGVYTVLKERTKICMFRNLFKRTFLISHIRNNRAPPTLSLSKLVVACRVAGLEYTTEDVEAILCSLIQQGLVKGYIHHERQLLVVLRDEGLFRKAFPLPYTIQNTQGETLLPIKM